MYYIHFYGNKSLTKKEAEEKYAEELFSEKCGKIIRQVKSDYVSISGLNKAEYSELQEKLDMAVKRSVCCRIHQTFGQYTYYIARIAADSFLIYKKRNDETGFSFLTVYKAEKDIRKMIKGFSKAYPKESKHVLDVLKQKGVDLCID